MTERSRLVTSVAERRATRTTLAQRYGVAEVVVSDFFAGVEDVEDDSDEDAVLDDDPESPFFDSDVAVDDGVVDDDLPRLSVL